MMVLLNNAAPLIYGSGMLSHQLIASLIPGTALALLLIAIAISFRDRPALHALFRLIARLFTVQFSIALASGLLLDTGLSELWPQYSGSLARLVHHPFGRSAFLSFLAVTVIIFYILRYDSGSRPFARIAACSALLLSAFFLSTWSVVVNTLMQYPEALTFSTIASDPHILYIDWGRLLNDPYLGTRMLHNYQASLIQGLSLVAFVTAWVTIGSPNRNYPYASLLKWMFAVLMVMLIAQPVIGHVQFSLVADRQPAKAAAMEGYYSEDEAFNMYLWGSTDSESRKTRGVRVPERISRSLLHHDDIPEPLDRIDEQDWPRVERTFHAFHSMIVCWMVMMLLGAVILCYLWFSGRISPVATLSLLAVFVLSETAAISGWLVSESGRQPWLFYGIQKVGSEASSPVNAGSLVLYFLVNCLLPFALLLFSAGFHLHFIRSFRQRTDIQNDQKI